MPTELTIRGFALQSAQTALVAARGARREPLAAGVDHESGYSSPPLLAGIGEVTAAVPFREVDEAQVLSYLGTPVIHPVMLEHGNLKLYVPDAMTTVTRKKTIVMTPVQGRKGSIKEYIAAEDYMISVQGLLVGQTGAFPESDLRDLIALCDVSEPIRIVSDYLRLYGVFEVVIESESHSREAGYENLLYFELSLVEDTPVALIERI